MNKKELVARIAQSTSLPQAQVVRALDSTIQLIREELAQPNKPPRALDSTINMIPESQIDAAHNKPRALDSTIQMIPEHLVTAGKVKIPGLGTFYTVQRKARVGRNPKSGIEVRIEARIVPKFKPSKQLIEEINK